MDQGYSEVGGNSSFVAVAASEQPCLFDPWGCRARPEQSTSACLALLSVGS